MFYSFVNSRVSEQMCVYIHIYSEPKVQIFKLVYKINNYMGTTKKNYFNVQT